MKTIESQQNVGGAADCMKRTTKDNKECDQLSTSTFLTAYLAC